MLRVPLVTILAREMRLKFFEANQRMEMWVALVTILAREMRLNISQVDQRLKMLRVARVAILAWEMRLKIFWSRPSFGDVANAASHDIGARNAIESFLKSTKLWRCCEWRWSRYWREKCDWKVLQLYLVPITWLAALGKSQFSIVYYAPISWRPCSQSHVQHHTFSEDCMFQSHIPHQYRDVLARNRMYSTSVSTAMALGRSSTSCGWVLAIPWVAIFTRRFIFLCDWVHSDCHE